MKPQADVAVVADADHRHAGRGDAADVVAGRVELELDEQLGDREAELRPVEEERLRRAPADRPHERAAGARRSRPPAALGGPPSVPLVCPPGSGRARAANSRERSKPRSSSSACGRAARGTAPSSARDRGEPAAGAQRQQLVEGPAADRLERPRVLELAAVARGHGARQEDADRASRVTVQSLRLRAERRELAGQSVGVCRADLLDPRVDAVAVRLDAALELRRACARAARRPRRRCSSRAGRSGRRRGSRAEDLREPAARGAAEELELEQAVLRDRVARAPPGVVVASPVDARHAEGVARDLDAVARALDVARLVELRRLAAGSARTARSGRSGAATRCRPRARGSRRTRSGRAAARSPPSPLEPSPCSARRRERARRGGPTCSPASPPASRPADYASGRDRGPSVRAP